MLGARCDDVLGSAEATEVGGSLIGLEMEAAEGQRWMKFQRGSTERGRGEK